MTKYGDAYLPGAGEYCDHEGSAPRVRPVHCTADGLTPATTPNWGGSSAKFLLVGTSVRAVPVKEMNFFPIW